jgi:hypothetical protein
LRAELGDLTHARAATLDALRGGRTQRAGRWWLVRLSITVVVGAVARFAAGGNFAHTEQPSARALLDPGHTRADANAARHTGCEAFVDGAVTVVVERIAHLFGRNDLSFAADRADATHLHTRWTLPNIRAAGRTHAETFVDGAVAVVVEPVADLHRRTGSSVADEYSCFTAT